jgi:uncharacterized protein YlxW (UPF0749 family)
MLLAAALKTQQNIRVNTNIPSSHYSGVVQALLDEKDTNRMLRSTIASLRTENQKYVEALSSGSSTGQAIGKELQKSKFLAGLIPAEGQGVEVTLTDSPEKTPANMDPDLLQEYIIHDVDLLNVVNELFANGAEAISIKDANNNQRVVSATSFRCVGGVIQINHVPMSPPFVVCAIGPKDTLDSALEMPGGMIERFHLPGFGRRMLHVRKMDHIIVPAYSEDMAFKYATESRSEGKH